MDRALLLYLARRLPPWDRTVLLAEVFDANAAKTFRPAVLPDGDRAQARRELVHGELRKRPDRRLIYLVDVTALPTHVVIVTGQYEGEKLEVREVFQRAGSPDGRDVRDAAMRFAAS